MTENKKKSMHHALLYMYAETPIHVGADKSLGTIDLPIQREASTGLPVIYGQSLKGALRATLANSGDDDIQSFFGGSPGGTKADSDDAGPVPGALSIGDAMLVAFPVPTVVNTFAWVTSKLALARLERSRKRVGLVELADLSKIEDNTSTTDGPWKTKEEDIFGVMVGEVEKSPETSTLARNFANEALPKAGEFTWFRDKFMRDLVVLDDVGFAENAKQGTEVTSRVSLTENKTVENGPWYVEALPSETILVALISTKQSEVLEKFKDTLDELGPVISIGGQGSTGSGLAWTRLVTQEVDDSEEEER